MKNKLGGARIALRFWHVHQGVNVDLCERNKWHQFSGFHDPWIHGWKVTLSRYIPAPGCVTGWEVRERDSRRRDSPVGSPYAVIPHSVFSVLRNTCKALGIVNRFQN